MTRDAGNTPITPKSLMLSMSILGAIMVVVQSVLSYAFLPTVTQEVIKEVRQMIREHEEHPHKSAVTRREFDLLTRNIDSLATADSVRALDRRMERIERQLEKILGSGK